MSVSWSYTGDTGCIHWGDIGFPLAKTGKQQSPINIQTATCVKRSSNTTNLEFKHLQDFSGRIVNTGFTTKVELDDKQEHLIVGGEPFGLVQFHFHSPSEHTIDDSHFPLELHLVHESMETAGKLAVVGVLFEVGEEESEFLKEVLAIIPEGANKSVKTSENLSLKDLRLSTQYWNYEGSLTTPPCSEGVNWFVLKDKHQLTSEQLKMYLKCFPLDTNRPTQPINERIISSY